MEEAPSQLEETRFEIDVSNTTLDVVLKKCEGTGKVLSKTRTKAAIARALKEK